jgi:hypothetical protein
MWSVVHRFPGLEKLGLRIPLFPPDSHRRTNGEHHSVADPLDGNRLSSEGFFFFCAKEISKKLICVIPEYTELWVVGTII